MRTLIYGITGMLGNTLFRFLSNDDNLEVYGTLRDHKLAHYFSDLPAQSILQDVHTDNIGSITQAFHAVKPQVVINCVGLVKQLSDANIPLKAITVNAQFPHQLSELCKSHGARLIHISTDCVFSGNKGFYSEDDYPDPKDLYGLSKLLGEVVDPHAITIRTSMIGHELTSQKGLVEWFLSQDKAVRGFKKAVFSGLPTIELSKVIRLVMARPELCGLYHVAAAPINKYDLLQLIAKTYDKSIHIQQDDTFVIDRSLNPKRFNQETGYIAPNWSELIANMYAFKHHSRELETA